MPPKFLYGKNGEILTEIRKKILSRKKIILFSDYDGTLTPIVKVPSQAVLSVTMRKLLINLNHNAHGSFGIVTGREHEDINKLLGIKNVLIISNHGFRITDGKKTWIHPGVKRFETISKEIFIALEKALKNYKGVLVQNKKLSLTVNYRNMSGQTLPGIRKAVRHALKVYDGEIKITSGKKVIEARPNVDWDKGKAVLKILNTKGARYRQKSIIYMGDDLTDEDVFKALDRSSITIHVGKKKNSSARFFVKNTHDIQKFLEWIVSNNN